jgi:hypothetical protein
MTLFKICRLSSSTRCNAGAICTDVNYPCPPKP